MLGCGEKIRGQKWMWRENPIKKGEKENKEK